MRALRTLISALCILAGALLIVAWGVSTAAVRAVEDGTALSGVARTAFSVPAAVDALSRQVQDDAVANLDSRGIDVAALGVEDDLRGAVDSAVRSPAFEDAIVDAADAAQTDFSAALMDPEREAAPLTLSVDASGIVNARIADLPGVGAAAPSLSLPPVQVEALSAESFENVRTTYEWMERAADWALWAGLALLALGILVSHRRRWFVAKALFAIGTIAVAFGLIVAFVDRDAILAFLPGGVDGTASSLWAQTFTDDAAPGIARNAVVVGAVALGGGVVATLVGKAASRR
ncbi:hypothetical protein [Demequina litorisediminis]|uniref:Uncharacterized protein n=1 Tax=Demequina litorisediminis TaxID=1849022 RepID=A0ABQ6I8D8_9MICO|nr:hypothetical protein [Demequina litorisediminis]GMA34059.1 hypothetical protein GCM10025876_02630 [Demequina litorisediminis]